MDKATVYPPNKCVLIRAENPSKYTSALASAKAFEYKGIPMVAIPHKPHEVEVLRTLGVEVPAPMNLYYEYTGRFKPFDVQRTTADFASMHHRGFILNSMGLGKTITTLWAIDYLRSIGYVNRVLVICPISVMERTWADEIFRNFPHLNVNVVYGPRDKRIKLLEDPADIYIVNTDGIKIIESYLEDRDDINMVVIDEVALFRNASSARWKSANKICNKQLEGARRVLGLTGSPIPNSPTDAFGQIKLVNPDAPGVPRFFGRFRDMVMLQINKFKWLPKADAVKTVFDLMQPAIRFSLDDAVDLPPQIVVQRKVEFTKEQAKAYKDMIDKLHAEFESGEITAVNDAVKAGKLLQITCGVAYDEAGGVVDLDCEPRLEATLEVIEESEGKVIIFVPLTGALNKLKAYLDEHEITNGVVDGSTPKAVRDKLFGDFQELDDPKVIIANPNTMSHGLTLTAATTICWYGPCYSNEIYQQACARVRRPGQKRSTVIVQMVSSAIEEKVYSRIENRQSIQGSLLDLIRESS